MRKNVRTIPLIALAAVTGANTQPPVKTFFQQLPAAKLPLPQNEVLRPRIRSGTFRER
jgi:hypothetical protein